ncbi:MAG: hypothetical protein OXN89_24655, partial [Bryobacterales bacterium]|nr:hypothetical protein [Bryobacterales bacterium]
SSLSHHAQLWPLKKESPWSLPVPCLRSIRAAAIGAASLREGLSRLPVEMGLELPTPRRRLGGNRQRSPQDAQETHAKVDLQCSLEVNPVPIGVRDAGERSGRA